MDLIVLSDWLNNVVVEGIHDTRKKKTIEVKFLLLFAEIWHVSLWQAFRNGVLFKLFSVKTTWTTTIFNHFHLAKSDYGSWPKLGVISQCLYSKIFIIKTPAVDTQE